MLLEKNNEMSDENNLREIVEFSLTGNLNQTILFAYTMSLYSGISHNFTIIRLIPEDLIDKIKLYYANHNFFFKCLFNKIVC